MLQRLDIRRDATDPRSARAGRCSRSRPRAALASALAGLALCLGGCAASPPPAPGSPGALPEGPPPPLPSGWDETLKQANPSPTHIAKKSIFDPAELPWNNLDETARRKVVFSERATFALLEIRRSDKPHDRKHWHWHDQISYVVEGEIEVVVGKEIRRVGAGSFYICESNVPHSIRVLSEKVVLVDVFSPPREDFRGGPAIRHSAQEAASLPINEVKAFVYAWFALFDRNAPVEQFLEHLAPDGLTMEFPEATLRSRDDFKRWYAGILKTIRTASHEILRLDATPTSHGADVDLTVVWRASTFAGEAKEFKVRQRWQLMSAGGRRPAIRAYKVEVLKDEQPSSGIK